MEAGAHEMALVVVRRDLRPALLEDRAVANRAVADAKLAELDLELLRRDDHGPGREHLPAAGVDHGQCAWSAGRERLERGDACRRQVEREREPARRSEAEAQPREAAGAGADHEPGQVRAPEIRIAQQIVRGFEHGSRSGDAFSQQLVVPDERRRGHARRGVKSESQHPRKVP